MVHGYSFLSYSSENNIVTSELHPIITCLEKWKSEKGSAVHFTIAPEKTEGEEKEIIHAYSTLALQSQYLRQPALAAGKIVPLLDGSLAVVKNC